MRMETKMKRVEFEEFSTDLLDPADDAVGMVANLREMLTATIEESDTPLRPTLMLFCDGGTAMWGRIPSSELPDGLTAALTALIEHNDVYAMAYTIGVVVNAADRDHEYIVIYVEFDDEVSACYLEVMRNDVGDVARVLVDGRYNNQCPEHLIAHISGLVINRG